MKENESDLYRALTPAEIEERTAQHLDLEHERDLHLADVAQFRSQIRKLNVKIKRLDKEGAQLRLEIRTGKVLEDKQAKLAFGVEPSPITPLDRLFPLPSDHQQLQASLAVVLQGVLVPSIEKLEQWGTTTGVFNALANWVRIELAYLNAKEIAKQHPELELPPRGVMPIKLAELRAALQRAIQERAGKRGRSTKPPPASSAPARAAKARRKK